MPFPSTCICLQESLQFCLSLSCLSSVLFQIHSTSHFRLPLGSRGFRFQRHSLKFPIGSYSQPHASLSTPIHKPGSPPHSSPRKRAQVGSTTSPDSTSFQQGLDALYFMQVIATLLRFTQDKKQNMQTCDFMANQSVSGMVRISKSMP